MSPIKKISPRTWRAAWSERWPYLLGILVVVPLGLASRRYGNSIPRWLYLIAGDALWATNLYCVLRFLCPATGAAKTALMSYFLAVLVEFSQTLAWPWLVAARGHWLGALVLGSGFVALDLLAYGAGVVLGWGAELFLRGRFRGRFWP